MASVKIFAILLVTFFADCRNWKNTVWKVIFNTLFHSDMSKEVKQICFNEENNSCNNINCNMDLKYFDRASSLICGNKTPTRSNRWYLLQILLHAQHVSGNAILCPSSGAREYYTDGRCLWYLMLWFSGCRYGVELKVMCPVCRLQLLMMGIARNMLSMQ